MRSLRIMTTKYFATEAMGTELREFSASYVHECFLDGSGVVRVQYPSGDVEYIAGTRYDPAPLRWRRRTNDGAAEVISTDLVLREFAPDVHVRDANAADLEHETVNGGGKSVPR